MRLSDEVYLMHFGIKGMKWGIRRTAEELGHVTKKAAVATGKALGKAAVATGKAAGKVAKTVGKRTGQFVKNEAYKHSPKRFLSDDEIKSRIARYQLEQQYQDLVNNSNFGRRLLTSGKKAVLLGLEDGGKQAISKAIQAHEERRIEAKKAALESDTDR